MLEDLRIVSMGSMIGSSKVKVFIDGPGGAGKTSIIKQLMYEEFEEEYKKTTAIEVYQKQFKYGQISIEMEIHDTANSDSRLRKDAICKADAVILVFALDNPESFKTLESYREEVLHERVGEDVPVPIIVVGNKEDQIELSPLTSHVIEEMMVQCNWNSIYIPVSAKTGSGVSEIFSKVLSKLGIQYEIQGRRRMTLPAYLLGRLSGSTAKRYKRNNSSGHLQSENGSKMTTESGLTDRQKISMGSRIGSGKVKIVVDGPGGTGKTSIIKQLMHEDFEEEYKKTTAIEVYQKRLKYGQKSIEMEIHDKVKSNSRLRKDAICEADAFILVYALDNPESFKALESYRDEVLHERVGEDVPIIVVGNKEDKVELSPVMSHVIEEMMVRCDWDNIYIPVSAKTGSGVSEIFSKVLSKLGIQHEIQRRRRMTLPEYLLKRLSGSSAKRCKRKDSDGHL